MRISSRCPAEEMNFWPIPLMFLFALRGRSSTADAESFVVPVMEAERIDIAHSTL